jgi:glycosyltransferase involved in cell wall biosynthesis
MPPIDHNPSGPRLTVAMPAYNVEAFIADAIESVLAQDFADFEFLLLDDGSTDRTREIAETYARRDKRLRLVVRENRGIAASLNELIAMARAPLVARADADDICEPTRFSAQVAFLDDHPDYGIVGCQAALIDGAGRPVRHDSTQVPCTHEEIVSALPTYSAFYHPAVTMRRDLVLAVGGYRKAYSDADDYDLWLRLSEVTRMANLPDVLIRYRVHGGQVSSWNLAEQSRRAAIASLAHAEREAGRRDPTIGMPELPCDDALDAIFGAGSLKYVRRRIFNDIASSPAVNEGEGWRALLAHRTTAADRRALLYMALKQLVTRRPAAAIQLIAAALGLRSSGTPT